MNFSPDNIAVIGGGRWARVLTEVLCNILPMSAKISVHSFNHSQLMSAWVLEKDFKRQIQVSSNWPSFPSSQTGAVIVVNAACDHEKAARWAISAGIPVLVEKPITLSALASKKLADLALKKGVRFAPAHVFLFSRYLNKFADQVAKLDKINSINVTWTDPSLECRYGEKKCYDKSLPVFADCLPHVVSIIGSILPDIFKDPKIRNIQNKGDSFKLESMIDDVVCNIHLERNGPSRQRVVEVISDKEKIKLDFSTEPGIITSGSTVIESDPEWETKDRPLASMLKAFLRWASGGEFDDRLNVEIGLMANRLIDKISDLYHTTDTNYGG